MKKCATCQLPKPLDEFGNNKGNADGKQRYCKACGRIAQKKHYDQNPERRENIRKSVSECRDRNVQYILNYLKDHPCVDCGESDPVVLEFDHRGDKDKDVCNVALNGSIERLEEEIAKCDVRCANCHRRKTAKQFGYKKLRFMPVCCNGSESAL